MNPSVASPTSLRPRHPGARPLVGGISLCALRTPAEGAVIAFARIDAADATTGGDVRTRPGGRRLADYSTA